jgi:hypothetical protein
VCLTLRCSAEAHPSARDSDMCFIVFNREDKSARVRLPARMHGEHWVRCIDTADPEAGPLCHVTGDAIEVAATSVVALALKSDEVGDE